MKKQTKKMMTLFLVFAMLLTMLAGCGGKTEGKFQCRTRGSC